MTAERCKALINPPAEALAQSGDPDVLAAIHGAVAVMRSLPEDSALRDKLADGLAALELDYVADREACRAKYAPLIRNLGLAIAREA